MIKKIISSIIVLIIGINIINKVSYNIKIIEKDYFIALLTNPILSLRNGFKVIKEYDFKELHREIIYIN